ncbi:MAG: histidine phosphatase family protein, partial [Lacisediminihabitans sp.]
MGLRQAAQIPDALKAEPIRAIFVSPLVRTQLTAEPLAAASGLEAQVMEGLQEIEAGRLEKLSDRESVHRYLETVFAWGGGDLDVRMPGGPDGHDFFERFDANIAAIAASVANSSGASAAVFSHGAAIRVWAARRTTNVPPEFAGL